MSVDYQLDDGIAVLVIANPPGNALTLGVRRGLQAALARAAHAPEVHAIVLAGADGIFCAGTDMAGLDTGALLQAPTTGELQALLEASAKPVVAALEGAALGEGFELALAAHWRVASREARLGLPDLKLGLIPGAGGTLRCTRLAGAAAALEMIGAARALSAPRALELGLVDALADPARPAALALARQALTEQRPLRLASAVEERVGAVDPGLFAAARRKLHAKAHGQLAPARVIDCIEAACTRPPAEALRLEREYFLECLASPERRALVHVFLAERAARTVPDVPHGLQPLPIRTAAVIGAGTMGTGIAMTFASAGIPVVVLEASPAALEKGLALVRKNYAASVARGSLSQQRADAAAGLVTGSGDYAALGGADIVIEAVFEDLQVKQEVFARLDAVAAPARHPRDQHLDARHRRHRRQHHPARTGGRHALLQSGARHEAARERARPAHLRADAHHGHGARHAARQGAGAGRQLRRLHRQPHAHVLRGAGRVPAGAGRDTRADRPGDRGVRLRHGPARGARPGRQRRRPADPQGPASAAGRALVADPRAPGAGRSPRPEEPAAATTATRAARASRTPGSWS